MLTIRQVKLIHILLEHEHEVSSRDLAKLLDITTRTVRNDIKIITPIIDRHGAKLEAVASKGYKLLVADQALLKLFLAEADYYQTNSDAHIIPVEPADRVYYIILKLLSVNHYLKLIDLADELFISESTIKKDLKAVKAQLHPFRLALDKKPNYGVKISGQEEQRRYCLTHYTFSANQTNNELEKQELYNRIKDLFGTDITFQYFPISDEGLSNLVEQLFIMCLRIIEDQLVEQKKHNVLPAKNDFLYQTAQEIASALSRTLTITLPNTEVLYIRDLLLAAKLITYNQHDKDPATVSHYYNQADRQLAITLIEAADNQFGLNLLLDEHLVNGLALHLIPTIHRLMIGMPIYNPLLSDIKLKQPFAFDIGIYMIEKLSALINLSINEDEAAYLALHVAAALEKSKVKQNFKRCIVICPKGLASSYFIYYKLREKFDQELKIVDLITKQELKSYPMKDLNFVISVDYLEEELPIPILVINPIIGASDVDKIKRALSEDSRNVLNYTDPARTFFRKDFKEKEEVLDFLIAKLTEQGLVNRHFKEAIYQREIMSPTCFGNSVAIPHPIERLTDSTFLAICTLRNPIDWDGRRVQFICMLSVKKDDDQKLQEIFSFLVGVVEDLTLVEQLVNVNSYQDFTSLIEAKLTAIH
ncbi:lichenan operon transcriptional antiterminator [Amphibacillus marinus]|uniref:Lichenan operon transcriptional antiterminator n=1 Tax=Amphibacillus marinus TaxID=872970 RepID=A0A1H8MCB3_9BACI|nr:BglG family transcription antiterminator [Amphibacillus marinus]SEO14848.1 lichenan operon transcriptional antiterminator [Amphibacillus marinus]